MKISYELLTVLIKTIRELERLESVITYSEYGYAVRRQVDFNELYFASKLANSNLKKLEFYSEYILTGKNFYEDLLRESKKKIEIREFNNSYILEVQRSIGFEQFEVDSMFFEDKIKIDYIVNAAQLFRLIYLNFPNNNLKHEFATAMTNAFLYKRNVCNYNLNISEIINSNSPLFNGGVIDDEKWVQIFLQLFYGQLKKTNERVNNMLLLFAEDKSSFQKYDDYYFRYITEQVVFTISDFKESTGISYNTAKKHLKELVDAKVLEPMKFGKHNAFVYTKLYDVWVK